MGVKLVEALPLSSTDYLVQSLSVNCERQYANECACEREVKSNGTRERKRQAYA